MIIIPEIETVYIRIPKTASKSMTKAIRAKYPRAFEPYRHMEITGVPQGYDTWKTVSVVRNPFDRMWSLYKFCRSVQDKPSFNKGWAEIQRRAASVSFNEWLINNRQPFCMAHGADGKLSPYHQVTKEIPENLKAQADYVNSHTLLFPFERLSLCAKELGVKLPEEVFNCSTWQPMQGLSEEASDHVWRRMYVDFKLHEKARRLWG